MNIYKILYIIVLCCVIYEGVAWLGRRSSRSSRSSSRRSSNGNSRSNSNSGGSGWWGGRRNSQSNPSNPSPTSKPKPKPPTSKPQGSGNKGSSWFWGGSREQNRRSKPTPTPKPKPTTPAPKPHGLSRWWSGWRRNRQSKPSSPFPTYTPKPTTPAPKPHGNSKSESKSSASESKSNTDMKKVIEKYEGMRLKAYDAQPKNKKVHDTTIGIGFNLNRPDAKKTFQKIVPGVDFDEVKSGEQTITKDQARALFNHDVDNIYVPRAKKRIGEDVYDKLPSNVKTAVVNAVYRGDLSKETAALMKEGKWEEVRKVYLDHHQYDDPDLPGVKTRMDWNQAQFDTMIKQ